MLPRSIKTLVVYVDNQETLWDMLDEQHRQDWAACDDALCHGKLEGLKKFHFYEWKTSTNLNEDIIPTLSRLLPNSYRRGILGGDVVSHFFAYVIYRGLFLTMTLDVLC